MIFSAANIMSDRWFRVTLDLEGIRRSLARADRTEHTIEYVRAWLIKSGFRPVDDAGDAGDAGDTWVVREADLGAVEPAEVRTIEEVPGPG